MSGHRPSHGRIGLLTNIEFRIFFEYIDIVSYQSWKRKYIRYVELVNVCFLHAPILAGCSEHTQHDEHLPAILTRATSKIGLRPVGCPLGD